MQQSHISKFKTLDEMEIAVEKHLDEMKKKLEEYSKIMGDKLRATNSEQNSEFSEINDKLNAQSDPKKKKPTKNSKITSWHALDGISIYNGVGTKGELELYFKAIEEIKSKISNMEKAKKAISDLLSKGVKKDLGCVTLYGSSSPLEMAFVKVNPHDRERYAFKSIIKIGIEPADIMVN